MGCVCTSQWIPHNEATYEWAYVTVRFSDEQAENTENRIEVENFKGSLKSTVPESSKSYERRAKKRGKIGGECIYSGELMKYHPGISAQFISRYCVLTVDEFRYYKSMQSFILSEKPLCVVPACCIESVKQ
jgi:hypothetical protein